MSEIMSFDTNADLVVLSSNNAGDEISELFQWFKEKILALC